MNAPIPMNRTSYVDAKHWAKLPREVVLRRMAPDNCLDSRVFYACLLWSECGPQRSEAVVKKDSKGFILRDEHGNEIPATQKDLMGLLGLPPGMKGEFSRQIRALIARGLLTYDGESLYLEPSPPAYEPEPEVAGTRNWHIGKRVLGTHNLPTDPVARTHTIKWLDDTGTAWRNDLKALRTRYHQLLDQATSDGLILIERSKRSLIANKPSSSAVNSSLNGKNGHPAEAPKAEEEESFYQKFKAQYPTARFDEPKAKASFQKKTPSQQKQILKRLDVYLSCERWKDEGGRWIPLASNWLESYEAEPPPRLAKPSRGRRLASTEEVLEHMRISDEFDKHAQEINDILREGQPLPADLQKLLDHMLGRT